VDQSIFKIRTDDLNRTAHTSVRLSLDFDGIAHKSSALSSNPADFLKNLTLIRPSQVEAGPF
jgi:hypothetical protein